MMVNKLRRRYTSGSLSWTYLELHSLKTASATPAVFDKLASSHAPPGLEPVATAHFGRAFSGAKPHQSPKRGLFVRI